MDIFSHAQKGHQPDPPAKPAQKPKPAPSPAVWFPVPSKAGRKPKTKGWAVETGLGLGPQFKDKRFP
jgi:hypothetical protein